MKIAKIIDIMKFFTSSLFFVNKGDNPALRVIIPTLWGASPHVLGKKLGPEAGAEGIRRAFWHAGARKDQDTHRLSDQVAFKKVIPLRRVRLTHQKWRLRRALRVLVPWKTILWT